MKIVFTLYLFFIYSNFSYSQNSALDSLNINHQKCLNKGQFMLSCSQKYYTEMDSMLNVIYKDVKRKLSIESDRLKLKQSELKWLKERDIYFEKIYKEINDELAQDEIMFYTEKKAKFVLDRINFLMNWNKNNMD